MDPILGVVIGLSMPMLFGFMLGYRTGKQAKAKEKSNVSKTNRLVSAYFYNFNSAQHSVQRIGLWARIKKCFGEIARR